AGPVDGVQVKIADFGLAKSDFASGSDVTSCGLFLSLDRIMEIVDILNWVLKYLIEIKIVIELKVQEDILELSLLLILDIYQIELYSISDNSILAVLLDPPQLAVKYQC
ncbi:MAG: hypothetical protein EZS28_056396, partial [Streblomastix strix]